MLQYTNIEKPDGSSMFYKLIITGRKV